MAVGAGPGNTCPAPMLQEGVRQPAEHRRAGADVNPAQGLDDDALRALLEPDSEPRSTHVPRSWKPEPDGRRRLIAGDPEPASGGTTTLTRTLIRRSPDSLA
jgi:hypothetical protein